MAVYTRQQTTTETQTQTATAQMPSMSLGSVIVESFQNTLSKIKDEGLGVFNFDDKPLSITWDKEEEKKQQKNADKPKAAAEDKEDKRLQELLKKRDNDKKTSDRMNSLIAGAVGGAVAGPAGKMIGKSVGSSMSSLLQAQNKDKAQEKTDKIKQDNETKKRHQQTITNTTKTHNVLSFVQEDVSKIKNFALVSLVAQAAKWAIMIQAIMAAVEYFPKIVEQILKVIDMLPVYWSKASMWFKQTFTGSNSIFQKAKRWIQQGINNLAGKMAQSDNPIISKLGEGLFQASGGSVHKFVAMKDLTPEAQNAIYGLVRKYGMYELLDDSGNVDMSLLEDGNYADTVMDKTRTQWEKEAKDNIRLAQIYGKGYEFSPGHNWEDAFVSRYNNMDIKGVWGEERVFEQFRQALDDNDKGIETFHNIMTQASNYDENGKLLSKQDALTNEINRILNTDLSTISDKNERKKLQQQKDYLESLAIGFDNKSDLSSLMLDYYRNVDYEKEYAKAAKKGGDELSTTLGEILLATSTDNLEVKKDLIGYDKEAADREAEEKAYQEGVAYAEKQLSKQGEMTRLQKQEYESGAYGEMYQQASNNLTAAGTPVIITEGNRIESAMAKLEDYFQKNRDAVSQLNIRMWGYDFHNALASKVTP